MLWEKCHATHFNALARRGPGRAGRVVKSSVQTESRAAVLFGVAYLDQYRLIALEPREVTPTVLGIEGAAIFLTGTLGIDQISLHQIAGRNALRITQGKWGRLHGSANGPPYIDERKTPLEQCLGLVGRQQLAGPIGTGVRREVVVNQV